MLKMTITNCKSKEWIACSGPSASPHPSPSPSPSLSPGSSLWLGPWVSCLGNQTVNQSIHASANRPVSSFSPTASCWSPRHQRAGRRGWMSGFSFLSPSLYGCWPDWPGLARRTGRAGLGWPHLPVGAVDLQDPESLLRPQSRIKYSRIIMNTG